MVYNKYSNQKILIDGITFASKKEAQRYRELKLMEKAGVIEDLLLQPKYILQEKFIDSKKNKHREITYIADFVYKDKLTNMMIIEDVKGMKTELYKLKRKLFLFKYPHFIFIEI